MLATARSYALEGTEARTVTVEVDVHRGLPAFTVVGLPAAAVREARERVRAAIANCGFEFPLQMIAASIAPLGARRVVPGLDLPIAAALLTASGQLQWSGSRRIAMVGELALDGSVRPVGGVLAIAEEARRDGEDALVVPEANAAEAARVEGIEVIPVETLAGIVAVAAGERVERDVQVVPQKHGDYAIWVDGRFTGMCETRAKAEQAAAYERDRPELAEERAVRILKDDPRFKDASWIGIENTGGGLIAAAIYPTKESPYVWITGAENDEENPAKPFFYGTYVDAEDEQVWLEHLSGQASDDDLADRVAASLEAAEEGRT